MRTYQTISVALALMLCFTAVASANIALDKPVIAFSSQFDANRFPASNITDGVNYDLSGGSQPGVQHSYWLLSGSNKSGYATIDLGGIYNLTEATLWNTGNFARSGGDSGTMDFRVELSKDNTLYQTVLDDALPQMTSASDPNRQQIFSLPNVDARYVRFDIDSVYPGDTRGGLNELELEGTLIPEPATMALLGFGGVAVLFRRRRR